MIGERTRAFPLGRAEVSRIVLILTVATGPAFAQRTIFAPTISLEEQWADNVQYVGVDTAAPTSDSVTRLGVGLALWREGAKTREGLQYNGSYQKYRTVSTLDHEEHSLTVNLGPGSARRSSSMGFTAGYSMGQTQGNPGSLAANDLYLSQRVTRHAINAAVRYDRPGSGRWGFRSSGWGSRSWYDPISGLPEEPSATNVEDRKEYGLTVAVHEALSSVSTLGWDYTLTRFDLAESGPEDVHTLSMSFNRSLSPSTAVFAYLGAFQRQESAAAEPAAGSGSTGPQLRAGMGWSHTGRSVATSVALDRAASSGGTLTGTSTDTTLGMSIGNPRPLRWSWSVSARYALRQATRSDVENLRTVAAGFSLERRWRGTLGLRLSGNHLRQITDEEGLAGSTVEAAVGLVWSPKGRDLKPPA